MPRKAVKDDSEAVPVTVQTRANKLGAALTDVAAYDAKGKPTHFLAEGLAPEWDQYPELVGIEFDQLVAKRVDLKSEIDFRTKRL